MVLKEGRESLEEVGRMLAFVKVTLTRLKEVAVWSVWIWKEDGIGLVLWYFDCNTPIPGSVLLLSHRGSIRYYSQPIHCFH